MIADSLAPHEIRSIVARERLKSRIERRVRLVTEPIQLGVAASIGTALPTLTFCYRARPTTRLSPPRNSIRFGQPLGEQRLDSIDSCSSLIWSTSAS